MNALKSLRSRFRRRLIASPLGNKLRRYNYLWNIAMRLKGVRVSLCPLCGYEGRFTAMGHPPRYDAMCPGCGSAERHRLEYLSMTRLNLLRAQDRVLHFAPEACLARWLRQQPIDYVTADLRQGKADIRLDIESIALPDESFDIVIANHVLEHVDDGRAIREISRILKKAGTLVAMVPLVEGWERTYENPSVATDEDRMVHYGHHGHVRRYGRDFRDLFPRAGFALTEFICDGVETVKFGLLEGERVFIATKSPA